MLKEGEPEGQLERYDLYFRSLNTVLCRFQLLPCSCPPGYVAAYVTNYNTKSNKTEEEERNIRALIRSDKIMKALPLLSSNGFVKVQE